MADFISPFNSGAFSAKQFSGTRYFSMMFFFVSLSAPCWHSCCHLSASYLSNGGPVSVDSAALPSNFNSSASRPSASWSSDFSLLDELEALEEALDEDLEDGLDELVRRLPCLFLFLFSLSLRLSCESELEEVCSLERCR